MHDAREAIEESAIHCSSDGGLERCREMSTRGALTFLTCVAFASAAHAQVECSPAAVGCHVEDVDFEHRDGLFDSVDFDTGWVPAGSPLQVRFGVMLGGATRVEMGGTSRTSWPPALEEAVFGREGTGRLAMDFGIEVIARIRFDVEVAGTRYMWEGDIPTAGFPTDLRVADEATFDPFLLPDAEPVSVADMTGDIPVIRADLGGGLIPIPGIRGGFVLNVIGTLSAAYRTDRIVVGDAVEPITAEGGTTVVRADPDAPELGGFKDVRITPEGTIAYEGTITLAPSLFIQIAGSRWDLPIAEVDVPIADLDSNTEFNTAEVHVALPDIRVDPTSLEFEATGVGDAAELLLTVHNDGEAPLEVEIREPAAPFTAGTAMVTIPPSSSNRVAIGFEPFTAGDREAVLFLASNDPDEPLVTVQLRGSGFGAADAGVADGGVDEGGPATDGGCGCRAAGGGSAPPAALLGLLALALTRGRRRPS